MRALLLVAAGVVALALVLWTPRGDGPPVPTTPTEESATAEASPTIAEATTRRAAVESARTPADRAATEYEPPPTPPAAGTIEVAVRRGTAPVPDGSVHVTHSDEYTFLLSGAGTQSFEVPENNTDLRAFLDRHGEARFTGLEPARYAVEVELAPDVRRLQRVEVPEDGGVRVVILVGEASLRGHVYDDDGAPTQDARVSIGIGGWQGETASVQTGADGGYRFDCLPAGPVGVGIQRSGDRWSKHDDMRLLQLREGEQRVFDSGSPRGVAIWSGRVRSRSGRAVTGGGRLRFGSRESGYLEGEVEEDGRFAIRVRPGEFDVAYAARGQSWIVRRGFVMGTRDHVEDVELPGTRLSGRIVRASGQPVTAQQLSARWIAAHPAERDDPSAFHRAAVTGPGTFRFDGLGPGRWLVSCQGMIGEPKELLVQEADFELNVVLRIP